MQQSPAERFFETFAEDAQCRQGGGIIDQGRGGDAHFISQIGGEGRIVQAATERLSVAPENQQFAAVRVESPSDNIAAAAANIYNQRDVSRCADRVEQALMVQAQNGSLGFSHKAQMGVHGFREATAHQCPEFSEERAIVFIAPVDRVGKGEAQTLIKTARTPFFAADLFQHSFEHQAGVVERLSVGIALLVWQGIRLQVRADAGLEILAHADAGGFIFELHLGNFANAFDRCAI